MSRLCGIDTDTAWNAFASFSQEPENQGLPGIASPFGGDASEWNGDGFGFGDGFHNSDPIGDFGTDYGSIFGGEGLSADQWTDVVAHKSLEAIKPISGEGRQFLLAKHTCAAGVCDGESPFGIGFRVRKCSSTGP